jgi:hypothetical protein
MPRLPWKAFATPEVNSEYVVMASSLPLRRFGARRRFASFVLSGRSADSYPVPTD